MKLIITGGNGFVGRMLFRKLKCDHEICIIDNLRSGNRRLSPDELKSIYFVNEDLRNDAVVKNIITEFKPDAIVHLAAIHYIPECEQDPQLALSTNVDATINLLSNCSSNCTFVFISSGAVYKPCDSALAETKSLVDPVDVYGRTKLLGELYVKHFARLRNFPSVIVRLFNVIGPGETNAHILPEIVAQIKYGTKALMLGNIDAKRDFIDVRDTVTGLSRILDGNSVVPSEPLVVNLASATQYSVRDILETIKHEFNIEFDVTYDQKRIRKNDRPYMIADISAINKAFCWTPNYSLKDTLNYIWDQPNLPDSLMYKYQH